MAGKVERGGVRALVDEYLDLRKEKLPDLTTKASEENPLRNRYKDVPCWDHCRVKLSGGPVDYIHGNWVDGLWKQRQFIATQGPLGAGVPGKVESTTAEFWRMVWEHKVTVIVMLCQTEEQGKAKCSQYWPLKAGERDQFGPVVVETKEVGTKKVKDHVVTVSTLELLKDGFTNTRQVVHFLHQNWPDR